VKKIETLAEDLCLVRDLYAQALAGMQAAKPAREASNDVLLGG
jgi:hypothetical protein